MATSITADTTRQSHLDALRGIAALIVLVLHYCSAFFPYIVFGSAEGFRAGAWENIFFIPPFGVLLSGQFAVCLFFILSGYVLSYSHLGRGHHVPKLVAAIIKRPLRLGGLIWFSLVLSAAIWSLGLYFNAQAAASIHNQWFADMLRGPYEFWRWLHITIFASFTGGYTFNPPLWTLGIELYGSILVYLFLMVFGNFKYRGGILLFIIWKLYASLYVGFWIGVLAADIVKHDRFLRERGSRWSWMLFALALFFASYPRFVTSEFRASTIYGYLPSDANSQTGYAMLAAALLFIFVLITPSIKVFLRTGVLQFFGRISYALYVLHFIILASFSAWLFILLENFLPQIAAFLVVLSTGACITVLAAHLATKGIDEPVIKLSHSLEKRLMRFLERL